MTMMRQDGKLDWEAIPCDSVHSILGDGVEDSEKFRKAR